jgi:hypothetical protein
VAAAEIETGLDNRAWQPGGNQGIRSRAKALAVFVVAIGNGDEFDPHGKPLAVDEVLTPASVL